MKYKVCLSMILVAFLAIGLIGCGKETNTTGASIEPTKQTVKKISAKEALEIMNSDEVFTIVDVRTQSEFDEGHIPGAILLPSEQLGTLAQENLKDKASIILVYCRSGNRSAASSKLLVDLGYSNVYDFGGIVDWTGEIVK